MDNRERFDAEIDLREYLSIILRDIRAVLAIFAFFVVVGVLVCLLMPKGYTATAAVMITPTPLRSTLPSMEVGKMDVSIPTHKFLLKSIPMLGRLIGKMKLTDKNGVPYSLDYLADRLFLQVSKETNGTNILLLQAKESSSTKAADLANAWAREYVGFSQEFIEGEARGTGNFIEDQFGIIKQKLEQSEAKVAEFRNSYRLDLMKVEVDIKKTQMNEYKRELASLGAVLETEENLLVELKAEINKQDKVVVISKILADDASLLLDENKSNSKSKPERRLKSEEINPIYRDLESRIVNSSLKINTLRPRVKYLEQAVLSFDVEIRDQEKNILQKEAELTQLNRQVMIYSKTYDNLSSKTEDVRLVKSAQLGEVKIVSPAIAPKYPSSPNKLRILAVSCVLGLMVGIGRAFLREFMRGFNR